MINRKLIAGTAALAIAAVGGGSTALAAHHKVPNKVTIKTVEKGDSYKINRWLKLGLRWNHDNYQVKSGGTVHIVNRAPNEGPHSWTVVKKKDLPRTKKQLDNCKICEELGAAHGATDDGPPKYQYLENGKGQDTPPEVDQPGDSALLGPNKGDGVDLHVTAKKGKVLRFMCLIHPWMQARVHVR